MSSLRELAIAKLRSQEPEAGQGPGQTTGQQVSRTGNLSEVRWDSKSGGSLPETGECPGVSLPRGQDSGTFAPKAGQWAGQQTGQPGRIDDRLASVRLREWHARLSRLDDTTAPDGFTFGQWVQRVNDACFLYSHYCSRAVRDGFSAYDLFGVMVGKPGCGGLVDRLRGARDLKMDADRAAWTVGGVRERFCRGGGDDLRADLVLIWEVSR
jgi:hypothetical protein